MIDFEHPTTRGATCLFLLLLFDAPCFNPRTHEGCDAKIPRPEDYSLVSIHAPTRGATACTLFCSCFTCVSIHAPTRGATKKRFTQRFWVSVSIHAPTRGATNLVPVLDEIRKFQSTHPRGVRR